MHENYFSGMVDVFRQQPIKNGLILPLAQRGNTPVHIVCFKLCHLVLPTKLFPTLPLHKTRSYAQLLHSTVYSMHQNDQCKSTCSKAAH